MEPEKKPQKATREDGRSPPRGPTPLIPQPTKEPRGMNPAVAIAVIALTLLLLAWALSG